MVLVLDKFIILIFSDLLFFKYLVCCLIWFSSVFLIKLILIIKRWSFFVLDKKNDLCSVFSVFVLLFLLMIMDIFNFEEF